jgi:hypothetical protein
MVSYITNTPTPEEINLLVTNPESRADFDAKYGAGASDQYIPTEIDNANINKDEPVKSGDGILLDAIQGPAKGLVEGVKETFNTVSQIADDLADVTNIGNVVFGDDADNGLIGYKNAQDLKKLREEKSETVDPVAVAEAGTEEEESEVYDSMTESITGNITQFAVGWITGGKALKSLGWVGKKGTNIVRSFVQGGIADFAAFSAYEERFTDYLIDKFPSLEDSYISYLAADDDDTFYEGKFKNTLEGVAFGLGTETIFAIARGVKAMRQAFKKSPEAAADAANKASDEISDTLTKNTEEVETTTNKDKGEEFPEGEKPKSIKGVKVKDAEVESVKNKVNRDSYNQILKDNINKARNGEMPISEALDVPINLTRMGIENDDDLIIFAKTLIDTIESTKNLDGVKSHDQVLLEADSMLEDVPNAINYSYKLAKDMEKGDAAMIAMKILYKGIIKQASLDARNPNIADEIVEKQIQVAATIYNNFRGVSKSGARITSAGQINISDIPTVTDEFLEDIIRGKVVKNNSGAKILRKKLMNIDPENTQAQSRLLRFFSAPQLVKYSNKLFINAILSSPKTHVINMTSNMVIAALRPLEQYAGGLITLNPTVRREALSTLAGLVHFYKDSMIRAGQALKKGDTILDKNNTKLDYEVDKATTTIGKIVETPTRFLAAEDEFFKQINFRAYAFSKIVTEALGKNLSTKPTLTLPNGNKYSEFDRYVADRMEDITRENGEAADEFLDALEYAQENTFTKKLEDRTVGGAVQAAINKVPVLRQIVPFVRTPVNLISAFLDRVPVFGTIRPYFIKQLRSPDPNVRASALGKQAFGAAFIGTILMYVNAGKITGGYERKERNLYKQKFDTGWRPYSIKIGDTYYSYERFDPLATIIGNLADYAEIAADITEVDAEALAQMNLLSVISGLEAEDIPEFAVKAGVRTISNLGNKSYLQSLTDFTEMLVSSEDGRFNKWTQGKIASFFPNIIRNAVNKQLLLETTDITSTLKKATGIYGNTQDLSYNALGEKRYKNQSTFDSLVNPVTRSVVQDDPLIQEFVNLNHGFSLASKKVGINGNINLYDYRNKDGQSAYDKLNELVEETGIREMLQDVIGLDAYKDAAGKYKSGDLTYKSQKIKFIEQKIAEARKIALNKLRQDKSFVSDSGISFGQAYENDQQNSVKNETFEELLPLK